MTVSIVQRPRAVGIDLGTVNSRLAYLDVQQRPSALADSSGRTSVPSSIYFAESEVVVGEIARRFALLRPDRVAQFFKRHMGTDWRFVIDGQTHTAEGLSAIILTHLVREAEPQIGPIQDAVITVPAYFGPSQMEATVRAGKLAGINVIGLVSGSVATALACGIHRENNNQIALVYHLGGGSLDVAIVRVTPKGLEELAIDGNVQLGGIEWDRCLVDYVVNDFEAKERRSIKDSAEMLQNIQMACEEAKLDLTRMTRTMIRVQTPNGPHSLEVTRAQFENITAHLLQRSRETVERALVDSGLEWNQIDRTILAGEATSMPMVRQMLRQLAGREPDTSVNAGTAVALGAAIYANTFEPEPRRPPVRTRGGLGRASTSPKPPAVIATFRTAFWIGFPLVKNNGEIENVVVIPRLSELPATATRQFLVSGLSGKRLRIDIVQGGTSDPAQAEPYGTYFIDGLLPGEVRSRALRVTIALDIRSVLRLSVFDEETGRELSCTLAETEGLSTSEVSDYQVWLQEKLEPSRFVEAQNPYVVGRPVEGDFFVGRNDVMKMIVKNLEPGAGANILVLRGQRRTGKTSVLLRLSDTLSQTSKGRYLPVFVDVQGLAFVRGDAEFLYRLAWEIWTQLQPHGIALPEPLPAEFTAAPTQTFEITYAQRLKTALNGRRVLLMLDEFEVLKVLIDERILNVKLLDYFRHLMQHSPFLFLIAGTHRIRELTGDSWSVFFNLAVYIDIGKLKDAECRWLITEPVRPWYRVEQQAVDELVRLAGCHPYFTQMVCAKLVDVRNESEANTVTLAHTREAVSRLMLSEEEQISYPWTEADCSADERLVMAALASEAAVGQPVLPQAIQKRFGESASLIGVGEALNRLRIRGVIQQDDEGRLSFAVPLFQEWIVRRRYNSPAAAADYNREHPVRQNAEDRRG
jgi:molecular chaperone DnaK